LGGPKEPCIRWGPDPHSPRKEAIFLSGEGSARCKVRDCLPWAVQKRLNRLIPFGLLTWLGPGKHVLHVGADFSLPHLYLVNPFPPEVLASENYSWWAILWHWFHNFVFSHFGRTPTCDRQTDRHGHSTYPTSVVSHGTDVHESRIYFASINTMSLSVLWHCWLGGGKGLKKPAMVMAGYSKRFFLAIWHNSGKWGWLNKVK